MIGKSGGGRSVDDRHHIWVSKSSNENMVTYRFRILSKWIVTRVIIPTSGL